LFIIPKIFYPSWLLLASLMDMVDLCCLFIPWFGLQLKFKDHHDFVDLVRNLLLWLERAFLVLWYLEDSCWNLGHFCVGRRSLDCRAPTWVRWIICGNGCLRLFSFIIILYWIVGFCFCDLLGQVFGPHLKSCISFSW